MTRAAGDDVRSKAQYGGTVSALVVLRPRAAGSSIRAVLTAQRRDMLPAGVLVRDAADVLRLRPLQLRRRPHAGGLQPRGAPRGRPAASASSPRPARRWRWRRCGPRRWRTATTSTSCRWSSACSAPGRSTTTSFARFLAEKVPLDRISKFDIPPPPANVFQVFSDSDERLHPARRGAPVHPAVLQRLPRHDGGVRRRLRRRRRGRRRLEHAHRPQRPRPGAGGGRPRRRRHRDGRSAGREPEPPQEAHRSARRRGALANIVETTGSDDDLLYLELSGETRSRLLAE